VRRVLFVCGKNRRRSPTAEAIFAVSPGIEVSSAGTALDAECPVSGDLLEWAEIVVVMERRQAQQLRRRFSASLRGKRLVVLGIPDVFEYMQPELVTLLRARASRWLH